MEIICNRCEKEIENASPYNFYVLHKKCFREHAEQLIKEFLADWNRMMERIEFHTENPDSELMDEVMEEYKKWEKKLADSGSGGEF